MENAGSIITVVLVGAITGYFAWRIGKERKKLRKTISILTDKKDPLVDSLERLLRLGEIVPATVH